MLLESSTCLGFSCLPCFNSWRTLHSCDLTIVTGCLNIDAVCLMGGMTERSFLKPLAKSGCAFLRFFLKSMALILPVLKSNVVRSTVSPKYRTNCGLLRNFFPFGLKKKKIVNILLSVQYLYQTIYTCSKRRLSFLPTTPFFSQLLRGSILSVRHYTQTFFYLFWPFQPGSKPKITLEK